MKYALTKNKKATSHTQTFKIEVIKITKRKKEKKETNTQIHKQTSKHTNTYNKTKPNKIKQTQELLNKRKKDSKKIKKHSHTPSMCVRLHSTKQTV